MKYDNCAQTQHSSLFEILFENNNDMSNGIMHQVLAQF